jgi:hypothetical protein
MLPTTAEIVKRQEESGVPFETRDFGRIFELHEDRANAFRIETHGGDFVLIISENFAFKFPNETTESLIKSTLRNSDSTVATNALLKIFTNELGIFNGIKNDEVCLTIKDLQDLIKTELKIEEPSIKDQIRILVGYYMVDSLVKNDPGLNKKVTLGEKIQLANDSDLQKWIQTLADSDLR